MLSSAKALQRPSLPGRLPCASVSAQPLGSRATPIIDAEQSLNLCRYPFLSAHDTGVHQVETPVRGQGKGSRFFCALQPNEVHWILGGCMHPCNVTIAYGRTIVVPHVPLVSTCVRQATRDT